MSKPKKEALIERDFSVQSLLYVSIVITSYLFWESNTPTGGIIISVLLHWAWNKLSSVQYTIIIRVLISTFLIPLALILFSRVSTVGGSVYWSLYSVHVFILMIVLILRIQEISDFKANAKKKKEDNKKEDNKKEDKKKEEEYLY